LPVTVGVPESTPFVVRVRPVGNDPLLFVKVIAPEPPADVMFIE
jgi:hypothetical protein